jgi:LPS export ABC transporter protein LptC
MKRLAMLALTVTAACGRPGVVPTQTAVADSADQIMTQMWTNIVRNGLNVSKVEADTAYIYEGRRVADLVGMKLTFFDSTGAISSVVTAKTGQYQMTDGILDARGNVVATNPGGRVLKTEHFVYDRLSNQIRSDTAFTFTSPGGNGSGASFTSDIGFRNIVTTRPRGQQRGGGFLLPGGKQ